MNIGSISVIGAGHGGHAIAADLSLSGYDVAIFSRRQETVKPILDRGGIECDDGVRQGFAKIGKVTSEPREAVEGRDLLIVTTPTSAHENIAKLISKYVKEKQIIFLDPGHTGGALEFRRALRESGAPRDVRIGESVTITHASRTSGSARVKILKMLENLKFAALPGARTDELVDQLLPIFPHLRRASNVLETGLNNINSIEHPPGMLMNTGWIEHTRGNFQFYLEGISPSVGNVIEAIDAERMMIARACKLREETFVHLFNQMGYSDLPEGSVYESLQHSTPNKGVKSPDSMHSRYIEEDVGYGLVPMVYIGRAFGLSTPNMDAIIRLCSLALREDYMSKGRTLEKMGLSQMSPEQVLRFVDVGA